LLQQMAMLSIQQQVQQQYYFNYHYCNSQGCWWSLSGFANLVQSLCKWWNDDKEVEVKLTWYDRGPPYTFVLCHWIWWQDITRQRLVMKVKSVTSKGRSCSPCLYLMGKFHTAHAQPMQMHKF
jgi:hypothetical protein